jgi:hypothetical protein
LDRKKRYTVRNSKYNGHSEGTLELKCYCLDCTLNDRTRYVQGFGLCHSDSVSIDSTGTCKSYHADFIFITYNQKYKSDYMNRRKTTDIITSFIEGLDKIMEDEENEL